MLLTTPRLTTIHTPTKHPYTHKPPITTPKVPPREASACSHTNIHICPHAQHTSSPNTSSPPYLHAKSHDIYVGVQLSSAQPCSVPYARSACATWLRLAYRLCVDARTLWLSREDDPIRWYQWGGRGDGGERLV